MSMTYVDSTVPANIRENLKPFPKLRPGVTCLECGYTGLMGITRKEAPWYASWPVIIMLCLTGIGLFGAFILGMLREGKSKVWCFCPNCRREIGPLH